LIIKQHKKRTSTILVYSLWQMVHNIKFTDSGFCVCVTTTLAEVWWWWSNTSV